MSEKSALMRYAAAVVFVAMATLLEWWLWPLVAPALSPLFLASVMFAAMYGGLGPGLLATVLAVGAAAYFFMPPAKSFEIGWDDSLRLLVFALVALVVSWLSGGRRRAEAQLSVAKEAADRANRAKDHFIAILSHELRTPITPVLLSAAAMENDAEAPLYVRESMGMIRQNIELQARIIDDLLDLTRIEKGKLHLRCEVVDVHRLLRQTQRIVNAEAEAKALRIELDLGASDCHVCGDPARLQQVFWNLLKNSIKFTPMSGHITAQTANDELGHFVARITDTGIGIEPDVLPLLGQPFAQGPGDESRQFGGLGLGLSICKAIVEMHGGSMEASSAGRDKGTSFTVRLTHLAHPTADAPTPQDALQTARSNESAAPDESQSDGNGARRSLRILLVEDDELTSKVLNRLLRSHGHGVRVAGGVRAALDLAAAESFDLVISDLGLPDGSGLDVMGRLAETGIKGIALSGHGMEHDVTASRQAGFAVHLTKPVAFEQLQSALEKVCA